MPTIGENLTDRFSGEELDRLGRLLTEEVQQLESDHEPFFNDIRVWWSWYEAQPAQRVKDVPWHRASNVVVPIIRTAADTLTARYFGVLQSSRTRLWSGRTENEVVARSHLDDVLRFVNHAARTEIDTVFPVHDWIQEMIVLGTGVIQLTWEQKRRFLKLGARAPQEVDLHNGPVLRHIPAERILWHPSQTLSESEIVAVQTFLTWTDLVRNQQTLDWRPEAIERTRPQPHTHGSPGAEVQEEKELRQGVDRTLSTRGLYDIRTAWVDWPWMRDVGRMNEKVIAPEDASGRRTFVPLVVEFCPDSKQVFRVVANPYTMLPRWPFWEIHLTRRAGQPRGIGMAKKMEHIQRAVTTQVNQAIDQVTLSNAMPFTTSDPKFTRRRLQPGVGLYTATPDTIRPLEIGKLIGPDIAITQLLMAVGERDSGVNDPLLGRESRLGGHPSPATNFLAMLQQSRSRGFSTEFMLGHQFGRIGEAIAALYQAFGTDPDGKIRRVFGQGDATRIEEWLFPQDEMLVGTIEMQPTALSVEDNPQQRMNKAVTISQMTQNYFGLILRVLPVLESGQAGPAMRQGILQMLETVGKTHQNFLESADFDDAREAVFQLGEQGADNAGALQQLTDIVQQAGGAAGGQLAGPGAGALAPGAPAQPGVGGVPPSGANGGLPALP